MGEFTDLDPTIAEAIDAFNDHDTGRLMAEFAENVTFSDPFQDDLSKAELRGFADEVFEAFPDVRYEQHRVISGDGEATAVEVTIHGTHEGEFAGIPPTRQTVALPGVTIVDVSEEGITSWRDYFDRQSFVEQLGLE
jgi:steroid delta-isomerase-like uncharacterized protein